MSVGDDTDEHGLKLARSDAIVVLLIDPRNEVVGRIYVTP